MEFASDIDEETRMQVFARADEDGILFQWKRSNELTFTSSVQINPNKEKESMELVELGPFGVVLQLYYTAEDDCLVIITETHTYRLDCVAVQPIQTEFYFRNWSGHTWLDLCRIYRHLSRQPQIKRFVYFAGDSSLDNKHWLLQQPRVTACSTHRKVFSQPKKMVADVAYEMNSALEILQPDTACIMTAVEETTLGERINGRLLMQDRFIRNHLRPQDMLVVSVGGNDIALVPTPRTLMHLGVMVLAPRFLWRWNPSFWYFVRLFKDGVQRYLEQLTSKELPNKIAVCMIYFPCEKADSYSWAGLLLKLSGYNRNPGHLQAILRQLFVEATQQIQLTPRNGRTCEIIPIPLFDVLDSKNPEHYVQRVEPSVEGGKLMARCFVDKLFIP